MRSPPASMCSSAIAIFPRRLRSGIDAARDALALLPHLTAISGQWLLLFAGGHPLFPDDPHVARVLTRLGSDADSATAQLGGVLTAMQRATLYLSHHGRATCVDVDPLCHICPLRSECPFPRLRSEPVPILLRRGRPRRGSTCKLLRRGVLVALLLRRLRAAADVRSAACIRRHYLDVDLEHVLTRSDRSIS